MQKLLGVDELRPWSLVVDFSAYKWRDVQSVVKVIQGRAKLYVFISTDSVYNNFTRANTHHGMAISNNNMEVVTSDDGFDVLGEYSRQRRDKHPDKYGYVISVRYRTSSNVKST